MISSGFNPIPAVGIPKTNYTTIERSARAKAPQGADRDSVSISSASNKGSRFMEMVSSMSKEVRTATSTSDIRILREQVASGQYTPDPAKIAASMLFMKENE